MPHIPKVVCGKCNREMERVKNGVKLQALAHFGGMEQPPEPYYKIMCDKFVCDSCNAVIYSGFAQQPFAEHYEKSYGEYKSDADFTFFNP